MANITPAHVYPVQSGSTFDLNPPGSGTFIPSIWSAKFNAEYWATSTFGSVSNTNWESEIKNQGDKVIIRNKPKVTAKDHIIGQDLEYEAPVITTQELVVDKGVYTAVTVDDVLAAQSDIALMKEYTEAGGEAIREAVDSYCWYLNFQGAHAANKGATAGVRSGAYNLGTDDAPVELTPDNVLRLVLAMNAVLTEQNVPTANRFIVIDPYTRYMLFQSDLAKAYVTGDSTSPIRNGLVGEIDGLQVYQSNLLPHAAAGSNTPWLSGDGKRNNITSTGGKRQVLIAGHRDAMTFASQVTKTDELKSEKQFAALMRSLTVFGTKVVKPEALVTAVVR